MPIWSLTKERVEKLMKQIGDMEAEIDTLITLTKEDLWNRDLDAFINEWRFQLEDEARIQKKVANMGRRASSKLKIGAKGPAARKRKAQGEDPDDSDFGTHAIVKKPAVVERAQPKVGLLSYLSPLAKPKAATDSKAKIQESTAASKSIDEVKPAKKGSGDLWTTLDGASQPSSDTAVAPILQKAKPAAEKKKPALKKIDSDNEDNAIIRLAITRKPASKKVESDNEDDEIVRPAITRKPRAAANKKPTYILSDSDSNGDDMLFDVGKMVKGIDNGAPGQSSSTRPLFSTSMSRPGSSAGLPKKSSSSTRQTLDLDGDDTDYSKLAPPPASKKAVSVTARSTVPSDDDLDEDGDDDFHARVPSPPKVSKTSRAPKPAAPKPAASKITKTKAPALAVKKASHASLQEPKKMPLSPAAKAYAAKKARNKAVVLSDDDDEDEVEKVANEIMDEDEAGVAGNLDDDDDDDMVIRRPARRAAAQAATVKGKPTWDVDSEDEDEEADEESEDFDEDDSE